jgi:hypothetical protein
MIIRKTFWLDGTETPIPRKGDQEAQKEDFSGKLYGQTRLGGPNNPGTVFTFDETTTGFTRA